jgi:hypothetical protein
MIARPFRVAAGLFLVAVQPVFAANPSYEEQARGILAVTGIKSGLTVHLGRGNGDLRAARC